MKITILFTVLFTTLISASAQNDPTLDLAYKNLKRVLVDFENKSVPFKVNNHWGIKSFDGIVLYQPTLDSIFYFGKNVVIAKDEKIYQLIDCNGRILFNKQFETVTFTSERTIECVDSLQNKYEISLNKETVELKLNPRKVFLANNPNSYRLISDKTEWYFILDPINDCVAYYVSDSISSSINYYESNKLFRSELYSEQTSPFINSDQIISWRLKTGNSMCFIPKINLNIEVEELIGIRTVKSNKRDYFVVLKKGEILILDTAGKTVKNTESNFSSFELKNGKLVFQQEGRDGLSYFMRFPEMEVDTIGYESINADKDFLRCELSKNNYRVFNNKYEEILNDSGSSVIAYEPFYTDKSYIFTINGQKYSFWDSSGKLVKELLVPEGFEREINKGVIYFGKRSSPMSYNMTVFYSIFYANNTINLVSGNVTVINENNFFIEQVNQKVIANNQLKVVKGFGSNDRIEIEGTGMNFMLKSEGQKSLLFNQNMNIINTEKLSYFGIRDKTKAFVDSPFRMYSEESQKHLYGLVDENGKTIQKNEFRIIISVNGNFAVVDKDYEIGYLDNNGQKLY
jgi:hypothetical protein